MTLSKTARILIALMLAVMAVFVWVNYFFQSTGGPLGPGFGPAFETPSFGGVARRRTPTEPSTPVAVAPTPAPSAAPASPAGAPAVAPSGSPAVASVAEVVGARDLEVAELPFLITEPPAPAEAATETPEESAEAAATGAQRPRAALRATVNPFSPVLVQEASRAPVQSVAVPPAPTERPVPSGTIASPVPQPIAAPAPRALTPRAPTARDLPRRLPGGTLPVAPSILEAARPVAPTHTQDLSSVAAIREPLATGTSLQGVSGSPSASMSEVPLDPIAAGALARGTLRGGPTGGPLAAGATPLARYLRDNDFRFTGSVLGPVSVGVFRSSTSQVPIVIGLGQSLPDTGIVLTDLLGHQAELTLDDTSQILTLDLRR